VPILSLGSREFFFPIFIICIERSDEVGAVLFEVVLGLVFLELGFTDCWLVPWHMGIEQRVS